MTNFYPWSRDKLIIGKFCQIAAGVEFVMNDANHQMNAVSTFPFYPSCDSVKQMNESNRMNTNLSREELIAQGRCSPSGRALSADRSEAETQPCENCRP